MGASPATRHRSDGVLSINLVAWDNGVGLSRDLSLLAAALRHGGFNVHVTPIGRGKLRKWFRPPLMRLRTWLQRLMHGRGWRRFDVNVMLEHIRPEDLGRATRTLFVPNPEYCLPSDVALLPSIDGVLTKTRHADPIFAALGQRTAYIGFTSEDRHDPKIARERAFFHLAGRSHNKGTRELIELWQRHPEWPRLTIVQSPRVAEPITPPAANIEHRIDYLDNAKLRRLQNASRFHLCPSRTEGYGHYLVEAMSVGAVVITTDGAPMNELVTSERGVLVASARTGSKELATTYFFDEAAMEAAIERLLQLPEAELQQLGDAARDWFLRNDGGFAARVQSALKSLLAET